MFTTHDAHRVPIKIDKSTTIWTAVEVANRTPWFIASVHVPGEPISLDFLFASDTDVVLFHEQQSAGQLAALSMMLPPAWDGNKHWTAVPIQKVERETEGKTSSADNLVITTADGREFSGFPPERTEVKVRSSRVLVVSF